MYGLAAFAWWGVAPLYFRAIKQVSAIEILCHRVVWSVVLLLGLVAARRELKSTLHILKPSRTLFYLIVSSSLICLNWGLFVYCVITARTLDASFGYFINPMVTIAMGVVLLRERLTRLQIVCVGIATAGVAVQLIALGRLPWLSLVLAGSFALYGLVRKQTGVKPIPGLTVETLLALPAALIGFAWLGRGNDLYFGHSGITLDGLLLSAGVITTVPLLLFVAGVQRVPLSTVGFMQYIAPSCQFLIAVFVIGEPLNRYRLLSFALVWLSLVILLTGSYSSQRKRPLGSTTEAQT
jgi:chloramphenicol-sensitive protein RarD